MPNTLPPLSDIATQVNQALCEDLGLAMASQDLNCIDVEQDITAGLIPNDKIINAKIITREDAVVCGIEWASQAFLQCDKNLQLMWHAADGDLIKANELLLEVSGNARAILCAERTALNFLQMLSATATTTYKYAQYLRGTQTKLLDTRKTIPGFRLAQKYAVACGGGMNHRVGLYDAFLIKENHIHACGSIGNAVKQAKLNHPNKPIEVEVESIDELKLAINAGVNTIMLDNFTQDLILQAVSINAGQCKLEVSGNITHERLRELATTGVDYISSGALTKHITAIDLSLIKQD
jgi:nicotinate-nucleotide pyrophosphorylase (carboxylating)